MDTIRASIVNMTTITLTLRYDPYQPPFANIIITQETTWVDVCMRIQEAAQHLHHMDQFKSFTYHNQVEMCTNEYEWRLFLNHLDRCVHCANKPTLNVTCLFNPRLLTFQENRLAGSFDTITLPSDSTSRDLIFELSRAFGRGRVIRTVLHNLTKVYDSTTEPTLVRNENAWRTFVDGLPGGGHIPTLTIIFEEGHNAEKDYIEKLESDLQSGPLQKKYVEEFLTSKYKRVHTDKALSRLFLMRFEEIMHQSTGEEAMEWYRKLNRITNAKLCKEAKIAFAEVAHMKSNGRTFPASPIEWQNQVPPDELWQLLDRNIISYKDVPVDLRPKLNDGQRLLDYFAKHPKSRNSFLTMVPFLICLDYEPLLIQRLLVQPSLYSQLSDSLRQQTHIVEAFLQGVEHGETDQDQCPWCFKYRQLPVEVREAGGLDLVSRCLEVECGGQARKRSKALAGNFPSIREKR